MKTLCSSTVVALLLTVSRPAVVQGQGTVTFNDPWSNDGIAYLALGYVDGMSFGVGNRTWPYDNMMHLGATGPTDYPHNGTPYLGFINTLGTPQHIIFARTNAASQGQSFLNGAPFGLVSVDLADPVAPSLAPISIVFNGFRADGSMITQTFTVGGGGSSTFQTFLLDTSFAWGLTRVEIPSPAWAMDNLVYNIPEPGVAGFLLLGLAALLFRRAGT